MSFLRPNKRILRQHSRSFVERIAKQTPHERSRSSLMLVIASAVLLAEIAVVVRDNQIRKSLPRSTNVPVQVAPESEQRVAVPDQKNVENADALVTMEFTGKLCYTKASPDERVSCSGHLVLTKQGQYILDGKKKKNLVSKEEMLELQELFNTADYRELRASTYAGGCPEGTKDSSEVKYTFFTSHGPEVLEACNYSFEDFVPFVEAINEIQNENGI